MLRYRVLKAHALRCRAPSEATVDTLLSLRCWKSRATHWPAAAGAVFAGLSRAILISAVPQGKLDRNARER